MDMGICERMKAGGGNRAWAYNALSLPIAHRGYTLYMLRSPAVGDLTIPKRPRSLSADGRAPPEVVEWEKGIIPYFAAIGSGGFGTPSRIFSCNWLKPYSSISGVGGQPGTKTSTGMILSTPCTMA
jgi:hypothetical protein